MRLNVPLLLWGLCMLIASAQSVRAADADLPPDIQKALPQLSSEEYAERQQGVRRIQASFSRQVIALASVSDPEASGDVTNVLATTDGEIRWLLEVLKQPDAQRNAQLEFAARPGAIPLLASVFSADETERLAGIHRLAGLNAPGVDLLLAQLMNSEDRAVSLAAMEVAWDQKPTDPLVDTLWQCAVQYPFAHRHAAAEMVKHLQPLTFRGQAIETTPSFPNFARSDADAEIATDVLLHLDAPRTTALVTRFFSEVAAKAADKRASAMQLDELSGNTTAMRNALSLAVHFKVNEALPSLYTLAMLSSPPRLTFMDPQGAAGGLNSCSNRTGTIACFLILADLPHDGFAKRDFPRSRMRSVWVDSAQVEEDASTRISEWWLVHAKDYPSP